MAVATRRPAAEGRTQRGWPPKAYLAQRGPGCAGPAVDTAAPDWCWGPPVDSVVDPAPAGEMVEVMMLPFLWRRWLSCRQRSMPRGFRRALFRGQGLSPDRGGRWVLCAVPAPGRPRAGTAGTARRWRPGSPPRR